MHSPKSFKLLFFIAALLQMVWGIVPSASQLVILEIPVELYISLRWTISSLIFLFYLLITSNFKIQISRNTLAVMGLGILGYGLGSIGTLYGLKIGGVTNFAMMGALNPIITSVISILFLKERPSKVFFVALPICVLGLLVLVTGKHQVSSWTIAFSSSVLIIGAAILDGFTFIFSKKLKPHFSAIQYLAISQLAAAVFMWLMQSVFFHQTDQISHLTMKGWGAAIFVSVVACVLCYAVLYWLLNYIDGHRLALFDGIHAVSATLFGWIFFSEDLNAMMLFAGFLLLSGLILGNIKWSVPKFR